MYQWINENIPQIIKNFCQYRRDCHEHNTRNVDDLHVLYGRLDNATIRSFLEQLYKTQIRNKSISLSPVIGRLKYGI